MSQAYNKCVYCGGNVRKPYLVCHKKSCMKKTREREPDRYPPSRNSARKNPTKAQKRPNKLQRMIASTKRAKRNRVTAALKKFLHQANPAIETSGAMITKLKGGGFTIRPIKAVKRGRR